MKTTLIFLVIFCTSIANAQTLEVGLRVQKTQEMYWENGVSAQFSFAKFKPEQFFLGLDYVTSRLGTAYQSNAIKQDSYLLSGSWLFNKNKPYHIVTRFNMGYFYSDLEEDMFAAIPNTSFLVSPEVGLKYNFKKMPISLNLGVGFYIITAKEGYSPGTLQPLYYHLDLYYSILKTRKK
ncbi:hypothetical protein [Flavobacterium cellulosilyticum]|uniref:DUF3575 domain-containing protein n=1 Tax=Flavobacterium cellulosilyticum TaxID=2541731 RepID=A0A4R5CLM2_9FLAO|nr:hypothetical protein [Flavobacterium cellulosilyticum]TDD99540.1 hypothetical protein E0F76_02105 [Flavobacterium cellulosilyticum]